MYRSVIACAVLAVFGVVAASAGQAGQADPSRPVNPLELIRAQPSLDADQEPGPEDQG